MPHSAKDELKPSLLVQSCEGRMINGKFSLYSEQNMCSVNELMLLLVTVGTEIIISFDQEENVSRSYQEQRVYLIFLSC